MVRFHKTSVAGLPLLVLLGCQETTAPNEPLALSPPVAPQFALVTTGIIELGSLSGSASSVNHAYAINQFGQVVGGSNTLGEGPRAFLWQHGAISNLGAPAGVWSEAYAINDMGQVVGSSAIDAGLLEVHAVRWHEGSLTDLGTLGGGATSHALGINNHGQIVGESLDAAFNRHAVLWENGSIANLGTLGWPSSSANDINDLGQIVGVSGNSSGTRRPVLWEEGTIFDLGSLGGDAGVAYAINEYGQIVGDSEIAVSGPSHAFLRHNGAMLDLGTLGGDESRGFAINDLGQVVGESQTISGARRAFLWMDGVMHDLGTLPGNTNSTARGINNLGEVIGWVHDVNSGNTLVRWQVVLRADIDVEPGNATNVVKLGGGGTLSVLVAGSRFFDASSIDPATVTLGNEDGSDTPVARQGKGTPRASLRDVNKDGYLDLMLEFDWKQLIQNGDLNPSTTQLVLLGSRNDGRRVRGVDAVTVK